MRYVLLNVIVIYVMGKARRLRWHTEVYSCYCCISFVGVSY